MFCCLGALEYWNKYDCLSEQLANGIVPCSDYTVAASQWEMIIDVPKGGESDAKVTLKDEIKIND